MVVVIMVFPYSLTKAAQTLYWEHVPFPPAKNEKSVFGWPSAPPEFHPTFLRHFSHICYDISPTFLPHLLRHIYDIFTTTLGIVESSRDFSDIFPTFPHATRYLRHISHFPTCNDLTQTHTDKSTISQHDLLLGHCWINNACVSFLRERFRWRSF